MGTSENAKSSLHIERPKCRLLFHVQVAFNVQAAFLFGGPNRSRRICRSRCCNRVSFFSV